MMGHGPSACQSQFATGVGAPAVDVAARCAGEAVRGATTCRGRTGPRDFCWGDWLKVSIESQKKKVGPFYRVLPGKSGTSATSVV